MKNTSILNVMGIMTGTSCDGADVATIQYTLKKNTDPETKLIHTKSFDMEESLRTRLRNAQLGLLPLREAALLNKDYSKWISNCVAYSLKKSSEQNTLIAIHGQTVWHEPSNQISVQLLDPSWVATKTGCSVVTKFRQADLTRGGQGAPLVPLFHELRSLDIFSRSEFPISIHNIGGISNFTYIDPNKKKCFGFDTGPGNVLIDLSTESFTHGKKHFDKNGDFAKKSIDEIDFQLIQKVASHPYFKISPPKSTGRELFNRSFLTQFKKSGTKLIAHATVFSAYTMAMAYRDFIFTKGLSLKKIYFCGGGAKNKTLIEVFKIFLNTISPNKIQVELLPEKFGPLQYIEAMAFSRLGFEGFLGKKISLADVTGADSDSVECELFLGKNFNKLLKLTNHVR